MKSKPIRRCVACFGEFPQENLFRVVKGSTGSIKCFPPGISKVCGRSVYICPNEACVKKALKKQGRKKCPLDFWLGQITSDQLHQELFDLVE